MPPTRRRIATVATLAALLALTLWGCYPKAVGPAGPDGRRLTWPEMDREQRAALMADRVVPLAAGLFRSWRPEKYAAVDCRLCHGPGAETGDFAMPTAHLPRLSGELLLGPEFRNHPETTRLKLEGLVPPMAQTLGKRPFSLVTRSGFGCYSCHLGPTGPRFGN